MEAEILKLLIKLLLIVLVIVHGSIAYTMFYRKWRTRRLKIIENTFATICSLYLYPKSNQKPNLIEIQREIKGVGIKKSKARNVQYLIDLMIRTQRSLLGLNYIKLKTLFTQIPPYGASANKLQSRKWYIKARGIREIYEMDQSQYTGELIKLRNNKNIYVRREAQIGIVIFLGWKSLRFLPYLKRQMTLWQQIKIVEKLNDLYPVPDLKHLRRAYNSDRPYANELIMRIIRKFNLTEDIAYIIRFIDSPKFEIREAAIYCISSFILSETQIREIKEKFYNINNTEQQLLLLKYIQRISMEIDLRFYKDLLYNGNDIIKLSTADILWNNGYKEEVQAYYYHQYTQKADSEPISV
ncbi:hypothetical protein JM83_3852 [Gillisia sp. Hel_I_86]|uniref:hypothetical protein n=1 Tax=Gillisia sp. Hel_I_86 TaxID=1249981 RepID=UPI00119B698F|nr:hypothetical protein [Gillisia sp. Hel_I_86]TVZ28705.1 hypothetical protein JM83_3852 [Gillisia sp. Hel_I_86]